MEIRTIDGRELWMLRIGDPESEAPTNRILCRTQAGGYTRITFQDILDVDGSYSFQPKKEE